MTEPTSSSEDIVRPEETVALARARVAEMRARGAYGQAFSRDIPLTGSPAAGSRTGTDERLLAWALIAPPETEPGSSRRAGAALAAVKRLLLRLLRRYHADLIGEQARFNVEAAVRLHALEQRMGELERRIEQ